MKYEKLKKYLNEKGIKIKEKIKPNKEFNKLSAGEKWDLVEVLLKDLGYIE